jgi:hypothetical protein
LARKEDFVGRSLIGPSTGGTGAGVELPRPWAGLMSSGDSWLRLRGDRPSRLLEPDSWRRPWRRWPGRGVDVVLRSGDPPTVLRFEARSGFAEGGVDVEGAAAPPLSRSEPVGSVYLVVCVCFSAAAEAQTYCCCVVKLHLFFFVSSIKTYSSVTELSVRSRVTFHER